MLLCFIILLLYKFIWDNLVLFFLIIVGVFIFVCGILVILCFDVVRRKVFFFYIFRSKFDYYIVIVGLLWVGWFVRRKLDKCCKNVIEI